MAGLKTTLNVVCLSDTHGEHRKVCLGNMGKIDILIHAGDWTNNCELGEVEDFLNWFRDQPARHRILVAGNHERYLDPNFVFSEVLDADATSDMAWSINTKAERVRNLVRSCAGVTYLENDSIIVDGIKIFGMPHSVTSTQSGSHDGFRRNDNKANIPWWSFPKNTDILVSHGPPFGIMDMSESQHLGSVQLRRKVDVHRPDVHVFGHIHNNHGKLVCGNTTFVNAALMNDSGGLHKPIQFTIMAPIDWRELSQSGVNDNRE